MKKLPIILLLLISSFNFAQECKYAVNVQKEDGAIKLTEETIVYSKLTPLSTDLIFFSLYKENEVPLLIFKYSRDSKSFPESICVDDTSRLSFQLINGNIVSLKQVGEATCGYIDKLDGLDKNNNTLESFFYLTPNAISQLKESKISFMGLRTITDSKDFVIPSELDLGKKYESSNPGNYFMENLKCIE